MRLYFACDNCHTLHNSNELIKPCEYCGKELCKACAGYRSTVALDKVPKAKLRLYCKKCVEQHERGFAAIVPFEKHWEENQYMYSDLPADWLWWMTARFHYPGSGEDTCRAMPFETIMNCLQVRRKTRKPRVEITIQGIGERK